MAMTMMYQLCTIVLNVLEVVGAYGAYQFSEPEETTANRLEQTMI